MFTYSGTSRGRSVPKTKCPEFDGVRTKIVSCCATSFDPKYSLLDSHHKECSHKKAARMPP